MNRIFFAAGLAAMAAMALGGCNTATPASRANNADYGAEVVLRGCSNCTVTVSQQLMSSADGQGDQTANPTQTASPQTDADLNLTKGASGGSLASAAAKALNAAAPAADTKTAAASGECADGSCQDR